MSASTAKLPTERRRFARCRKRISCRISWNGVESSAWLCDFSASGLLVQTNLRPPLGATVQVELRAEDQEPVFVTATVVRFRRSHRSTHGVVPPQIGLALLGAPEAYFQLVSASS